jgi:hypothetical protein
MEKKSGKRLKGEVNILDEVKMVVLKNEKW